jgi:hypothetical protein
MSWQHARQAATNQDQRQDGTALNPDAGPMASYSGKIIFVQRCRGAEPEWLSRAIFF